MMDLNIFYSVDLIEFGRFTFSYNDNFALICFYISYKLYNPLLFISDYSVGIQELPLYQELNLISVGFR